LRNSDELKPEFLTEKHLQKSFSPPGYSAMATKAIQTVDGLEGDLNWIRLMTAMSGLRNRAGLNLSDHGDDQIDIESCLVALGESLKTLRLFRGFVADSLKMNEISSRK
jgi:hypothetical protein